NCLGVRNAPPLMNLAWQKEFMLDGGINHLDKAPLRALLDTCEMDSNLDTIVARLKKDKQYPSMFKSAFGSDKITTQKIMKALSQYMVMLISANSKYDKYMRHEVGGEFTPMEKEGYELFKANCTSCHKEPLFSDYSYRNNGLDSVFSDDGRYIITKNAKDKGLFKVPTLRNITLTYPYMHDGRYPMLYHALAHYSKKIINSPNLDPVLIHNGKVGFDFTDYDLMKLEVFLKTLTDTSFVKDKRFEKPKDINYKNQVYF
ncbi:MAG: cytochrome-c peroxidase, partial [Pseudopedobacter saltans]